MAKTTYEFDFSYYEKWEVSGGAEIAGGILDISGVGDGYRKPDVNWYSGINDDFIVEVEFRQDSVPDGIGMSILVWMEDAAGDYIFFEIYNTTMRIYLDIVRASQTFNPGTTWHTAKIRRIGTIYYFSIDGGTEISWNYGIPKKIYQLNLGMIMCNGDYDNFKYSWVESEEDYAFIM